jgi:hypothetical protein
VHLSAQGWAAPLRREVRGESWSLDNLVLRLAWRALAVKIREQAFALFRPLMADLRFFVTQEGTLNKGGSGNDTVFNFTGVGSSTTIKGIDGDDLIQLTNQTTAITVRSNTTTVLASAGANSAGFVNTVYSGAYESAGTIAFGIKTAGSATLSAGAVVENSYTIQNLQATGIQNLRSTLIAGGKGNDSIYLGDQLATFDKASVRGGAGNDILGSYNSGASTAGDFGHFSGSEIKGGAGNDTVFAVVSASSATSFKTVGNAGNDSVAFSASNETNKGFVGGGAGNDTITFVAVSANSITVKGGDGKDSINFNASTDAEKGLINAGSGADTINLTLGIVSATSVYGGEGDDSIVASGVSDGGSNIFDAGAGADTVFFQSAEADTISASTVAGGAGDDSILLHAMSAGSFQSGFIKGGAGNDTITIDALQAAGSAGMVGSTIKGGAGADSITVSAVGAGSELGASATFAYDTWNQSTLSSMDTLTFNTAAVSAGASFDSAQILVDVSMGLTTGVSGAGAVGAVSASGGFVVWSGYSDNSLTARVSAINAGYTTTGDFAVFTTDNTTRYLFVQGGTTDLVARLSDDDQLSAGLGTLIRSGNSIGFGS